MEANTYNEHQYPNYTGFYGLCRGLCNVQMVKGWLLYSVLFEGTSSLLTYWAPEINALLIYVHVIKSH